MPPIHLSEQASNIVVFFFWGHLTLTNVSFCSPLSVIHPVSFYKKTLILEKNIITKQLTVK